MKGKRINGREEGKIRTVFLSGSRVLTHTCRRTCVKYYMYIKVRIHVKDAVNKIRREGYSIDNIKKDLRENSIFLYNTTSRSPVKRRNIDATDVSNVQIFLQNCIFLETTTSIISTGKDLLKTTRKEGGGGRMVAR